MVGDLRKFFRKLFRNTGCATLRRNVQHSLTSFCTTLSYRVAVHVFLGTRAQVYTRDATHRPTATLTPGRGVLCLWSGGFVGGGRPPGVFVGENQGLF